MSIYQLKVMKENVDSNQPLPQEKVGCLTKRIQRSEMILTFKTLSLLETTETRGVGMALRGQRYCTQAGADRGGGHEHLQDVITS